MSDAKTLYEEDFFAWTQRQAKALRDAARNRTNQPLDWENLAEEIEGLDISERSALGSHTMRIVQHFAKLEFSPTVEPRNGWRRTIRLARLQAQRRLEDNPSLKSQLSRIIEQETRRGIEYAIADFEENGEIDEVDANALRDGATRSIKSSPTGFRPSRHGRISHAENGGDRGRLPPYIIRTRHRVGAAESQA